MSNRGGTVQKKDAEGLLEELRAELRRLLNETANLTNQVEIRPDRPIDIREEVARYERQLITAALRIAKGKQKDAARLLRLSPSTLNVKIKALGIEPSDL
jgi:DNA-binding NtrC family response regulator